MSGGVLHCVQEMMVAEEIDGEDGLALDINCISCMMSLRSLLRVLSIIVLLSFCVFLDL